MIGLEEMGPRKLEEIKWTVHHFWLVITTTTTKKREHASIMYHLSIQRGRYIYIHL